MEWVGQFGAAAAVEQKSLLGRYQLLAVLLSRLDGIKKTVADTLTQRSPLERYEDIDPRLKERWEEELTASIEAEYRRQRSDLLKALEWWLRDVWLESMQLGGERLTFPSFESEVQAVAKRITPDQALENLTRVDATQRLLSTNVQEALALEVGLLQLHL